MAVDENAKKEHTSIVSLREITEETLISICKLSDTLSELQKKMVAPNAQSIAQAHFNNKFWFKAIYVDKTPVGFIMPFFSIID